MILVPIGEGRLKGYSFSEHRRCSGVLDITMFLLLLPDVGLQWGFRLKLGAQAPARQLCSSTLFHLHN